MRTRAHGVCVYRMVNTTYPVCPRALTMSPLPAGRPLPVGPRDPLDPCSLLVLVKVVLTMIARHYASGSLDLAQLARIRPIMEYLLCHRGNGKYRATQLKMVNSPWLYGAVLGIND